MISNLFNKLLKINYFLNIIIFFVFIFFKKLKIKWGLGIGDWGLGIGD